ncbi:TRAP transporter small permease [Cognatishimia maritima]|uniref:TRAP transporter small permease protein n=1 Tax=Cognatishimia maritima TaxID=870908 RepID=A0A1M5WIC7_9RHOB|nr:TRAP transporter small permease [Cognatishimia maritima]SHH87177.1 TRAP-type C4-dicarboxylate transport system, small permease component [Cognatishimia maritima]
MSRHVELLGRVASLLETTTLNLCVLLAVLMSATLLAELVARNLIGTTLIWSAEFATMCFIWIAFLGSTAAARRRDHFNVDLIGRWVPAGSPAEHWLLALTAAIFAGFGAVLLINGISFAETGMRRFSFSLGIPQGYTMLIMPVSGALFLFYGCVELLELFIDEDRENVERA